MFTYLFITSHNNTVLDVIETCQNSVQCLIIILHPALIHYHNKIKSHILSNTFLLLDIYKYKLQCQLTSLDSPPLFATVSTDLMQCVI